MGRLMITHLNTKLPIWVGVLLGAIAVAFAQPAAANQFNRINDVNVACSNSLQCDLFITDPRVTLYTFALRRGSASAADMSIVLSTRQALAAGSEVALRVDGVEIARFDESDLSYRAAVYEYVLRDPDIVSDVLQAASNGRVLQVEYATRGGQTAANFGLSGFVEGLRFADAVQGRQGADNAWARFVGGNISDAVIGVSPIALFEDVPFLIRSRFFRRGDAFCAGADTLGAGFNSAFSVTVGEAELYALPCGPSVEDARAYSLFAVDGGEVATVPFPTFDAIGPTVRYRATNLSWDSDAGRLVSTGSIGECGQTQIWAVAGGNPVRLVLEASQADDGCLADGAANASWLQQWPPVD